MCTEQGEQCLTITSCHVKLEVEKETHSADNIKPRDGQNLPAGNVGGKRKGQFCSEKNKAAASCVLSLSNVPRQLLTFTA